MIFVHCSFQFWWSEPFFLKAWAVSSPNWIGLWWLPLNWIIAHRNPKRYSGAASNIFLTSMCGCDLISPWDLESVTILWPLCLLILWSEGPTWPAGSRLHFHGAPAAAPVKVFALRTKISRPADLPTIGEGKQNVCGSPGITVRGATLVSTSDPPPEGPGCGGHSSMCWALIQSAPHVIDIALELVWGPTHLLFSSQYYLEGDNTVSVSSSPNPTASL
jgi:hypothetical protein